MTAKEILYQIKGQHNIGTAWQCTEHVIIEAMEEYAKQQVKEFNTNKVITPSCSIGGYINEICYLRNSDNSCDGCPHFK